jgi:hypothetical protein
MNDRTDPLLRELRAFGLGYPEAHSKSPWPDHDDLAVRDKTFAYLPAEGQPFSLSVKLPYTGEIALALPYAKPTGYGLGKSGWVTFTPTKNEMPSLEQLPRPGAPQAGEGARRARRLIHLAAELAAAMSARGCGMRVMPCYGAGDAGIGIWRLGPMAIGGRTTG